VVHLLFNANHEQTFEGITRNLFRMSFSSQNQKKKVHCKKYIFKICYYNIFSFVKSNQIYLVEITYYFEFMMIKLIYFIVLTYFFQFNQLKILRQPSYLLF